MLVQENNIEDLIDIIDIKKKKKYKIRWQKLCHIQICHTFCQNKSYVKKCNSIIF